jgi:TPR repeat protein
MGLLDFLGIRKSKPASQVEDWSPFLRNKEVSEMLKRTLEKAKKYGGDPFYEYRKKNLLPPTYEYGMNCELDRTVEFKGMKIAQKVYEEIKRDPQQYAIRRDPGISQFETGVPVLFGVRSVLTGLNAYNRAVRALGAELSREKEGLFVDPHSESFFLHGLYCVGKALDKGGSQAYIEAATCFQKAADLGHRDAQYFLANLYYNGAGVKKDFSEAAKWVQKAAEQEHEDAQFRTGVLYRDGVGVNKDYREAARWFRRAAEKGHRDAQCSVALLYYDGEGVDKDYAEAAKWFREAAEQGDESAPLFLGWIHFVREGVDKNYPEALKWFQKDCKTNNRKSSHDMVKHLHFVLNPQEAVKEIDVNRALGMVAAGGYMDALRALLEKGTDVNARTRTGGTALMCAAQEGHIDIAQVLLANGADVNARDNDNWTALMFATWKDHPNMVRLLLDKGAKLEV